MNAHLQPTGSAYFITKETQEIERHTLSVLVDNEPGILARVVGLFSARGYNIESLTVSETEHGRRLSRITVVVIATPKVLVQIKLQLERLVPVHRVHDLTADRRKLVDLVPELVDPKNLYGELIGVAMKMAEVA